MHLYLAKYPDYALIIFYHIVYFVSYILKANSIDKYNVTLNINCFYSMIFMILHFHRLAKNLGTRKGSRRGNSGNRLELLVLVHLHHVP